MTSHPRSSVRQKQNGLFRRAFLAVHHCGVRGSWVSIHVHAGGPGTGPTTSTDECSIFPRLRLRSSASKYYSIVDDDDPTVKPPSPDGEDLPGYGYPAPRRPWWRRRCFIISAVLSLAVVALLSVFVFKFGTGFHCHHDATNSLSKVTTPNASYHVMNMNMVDEAPTTRHYDFVVEEAMGAPDGVEKLMLVVNGWQL